MKRTRRDFAKLAATVIAAAPLVVSEASAQVAPVTATPASTPVPPPPTSETVRLSEAQTAMLRARYGKHLSADDTRTIEKDLDDTAAYMRPMHEVTLTNADEPDSIFFAEGGPR